MLFYLSLYGFPINAITVTNSPQMERTALWTERYIKWQFINDLAPVVVLAIALPVMGIAHLLKPKNNNYAVSTRKDI